jgi:hypothetical protein
VTGAASKKAVGESLDATVANLSQDLGNEGNAKRKPPKGSSTAKRGTPRVTDESKKLQKDIKAYLILTIPLNLPIVGIILDFNT